MLCEFFIPGRLSTNTSAAAFMDALMASARAYGDQVKQTQTYFGQDELLVLYGVGEKSRDDARREHVASGRRALLWDLGYFGPDLNRKAYLRCSIDHEHPQAWLSRTPPDPSRWDSLGITLRDDYELGGHIILVGLGRKSRSYLREPDWESRALTAIRIKHPGQRIIYRPKLGHPSPKLNVDDVNEETPIHTLLRGASLVVCRHSNVAVDAAIAGVPFECVDGAAMWLVNKPFTRENRLDFLRRLAWWQWKVSEARDAWFFARKMLKPAMVAA